MYTLRANDAGVFKRRAYFRGIISTRKELLIARNMGVCEIDAKHILLPVYVILHVICTVS